MEHHAFDSIVGRYNLDYQGQCLSFVVVPPTMEVGVRDMCPSPGSASHASERASEGHGGVASNDIDCRVRRPRAQSR